MKKILIAAVVGAVTSTAAHAVPVQWSSKDGGNDHWYEIIGPEDGRLKWGDARILAESRSHLGQTGYLASVTSAAEQAFLDGLNAAHAAALSLSQPYVSAWLGGSDRSSEGTWQWTTGEVFGYTNWAPGQPSGDALGKQDWLVGWGFDGNGGQTALWNDCSGKCADRYVVEFDGPPFDIRAQLGLAAVPTPASLPLLGLSVLGAFGVARRRQKQNA